MRTAETPVERARAKLSLAVITFRKRGGLHWNSDERDLVVAVLGGELQGRTGREGVEKAWFALQDAYRVQDEENA